jgi:hypothetical protein
MADESMWIERAQSAEAKLKTMQESHEAAVGRVKNFKANFGVRERDNGEIVIDFPKFVGRLGPDAAAELRAVIDEKYPVKAPSKPRSKTRKPVEEKRPA